MKLAAVVFAIALAIIGAEIALRLFVPVRSVGPVATTHDPVYGKRLKRGYSGRRTTEELTYWVTVNSRGFRGPEMKLPVSGAVLCLGDSFTMGTAARDGEEYPAVLRSIIDDRYGEGVVPVINGGVPNTGNGRWVKFLRTEAEQLEPRFVILQLYCNDFADNINDRLYSLDAQGEMVELPVPEPGWAQRAQQIVEAVPIVNHSYLLGVVRQAVSNLVHRSQVSWDETDRETVDPLTYAIIDASLRACDDRGWPAGVVMVDLDPDQEDKVRAVAESWGVPVLRVPSKAEMPEMYWKIDPHWNQEGSRMAAEQIYSAFLADIDLREPPAK